MDHVPYFIAGLVIGAAFVLIIVWCLLWMGSHE